MPADVTDQQIDPAQYKNITRELYSKNVELVNVNKTLELLQELYQIIIESSSVEEVGQKFIEKIVGTLSFTDGLVLIKDEGTENLKAIGVTNTEINNTLSQIAGIHLKEAKIPLEKLENTLVGAFRTGKDAVANSLPDLWAPLIKHDDLSSLNIVNRKSIVFPISFGEKLLGSFALTFNEKVDELTSFESALIMRVRTVFGIAIDRINTSQQLKEAQESELAKARELVRLKDEFVFIATHDLRTPVTAIKGFVDLMGDRINEFDEDLKEDINAIIDSADRLDQLIEDLLEVARSESGTIKIEVEPISLNEAVQKSVKQIELEAQKKGLKVEIVMPDQITVLADREKLHEALENLLSNAVKYNKQNGSVRVEAKIIDNQAQISVVDTGIGIPQNMQNQVFQKFFRARMDGTENVPGTGLGLFVVRMLIEKMNGVANFTSKEGEGTAFTVTLPISAQPLAKQAQTM